MRRKRGRTVSYVLVDETGCYVTDCGPLGPWAGDPVEMRFHSLKEARQVRWEMGGEQDMEIIKETVEAVG